MDDRILAWIEEHARQEGFTDKEDTLALVAEVRLLRQELRDRAEHDPRCPRSRYIPEGNCTCGLDELLDLR